MAVTQVDNGSLGTIRDTCFLKVASGKTHSFARIYHVASPWAVIALRACYETFDACATRPGARRSIRNDVIVIGQIV